MDINPMTQKISDRIYKGIIDDLFSCNFVDSTEKSYMKQLSNLWHHVIDKGNFRNIKYNIFIEGQRFPLENNWGDYKFTMFFDIPNVLISLQKQEFTYMVQMLSYLRDGIHYTRMKNTYWDKNAMKTPVLAVVMPTNYDNKMRHYEVIDGNHRVTYASDHNIDIQLHVVITSFLPPKFFMDSDSWLLYHILTSFYLVAGRVATNPDEYISDLERHLELYSPQL